MGFLDTGNKEHQEKHQLESARVSSGCSDLKRRELRYFSQMDLLPPVFGSHFDRVARGTDLNSSSRDIELNLSETCHQEEQHELLSAICRFFYEKFG